MTENHRMFPITPGEMPVPDLPEPLAEAGQEVPLVFRATDGLVKRIGTVTLQGDGTAIARVDGDGDGVLRHLFDLNVAFSLDTSLRNL